MLRLIKYSIKQRNIFFKVTTSEERSVTESTDSTAKLKHATSESEKEEKKKEKKETLNEKIDRLALECSEDDEDFDVSDQSVIFLFNTRYLLFFFFFIPDDTIKFIVHSNGVSRSQSICGFEENSVTLLRQIARNAASTIRRSFHLYF